MKIAIIGTGGVGGYFVGKLAIAGCDVTFLARGEHLKAIQQKGLAGEGCRERTEQPIENRHPGIAASKWHLGN